jgi:ATPase family AAA domain-containing protein 3A/B
MEEPQVYRNAASSGFDASGLEEAAALVRQLPRGITGATQVQQLKLQEQERITAAKKKATELQEHSRQLDQHYRAKVDESNRAYRGQQQQHDKTRAEYRDQLARQREVDMLRYREIEKQKQARAAEEAQAREEQIRRDTLEYEAQLRQQTELARVAAETKGNILAQRKNHDIRMEQLRQDRREARKTLMDGIRLAGDTLGRGASEFLSNRSEMTAAVATLSAVALGVYAAKTGTGVAGRYIEARLGKPSLVRETSRRSALDVARHPLKSLVRAVRRGPVGDALGGSDGRPRAIFASPLEARLRRVAESAANTKSNKAPFRHLLLYGESLLLCFT